MRIQTLNQQEHRKNQRRRRINAVNLQVSQSIYYTNLPITVTAVDVILSLNWCYSPIYRFATGGGGEVKVVFDIRLWI